MPHKALWVNHDATQEVKYIEGGYKPSEGELLLKCICVGVNPGDYTHPENFGAVDTVEGFDAVGEIMEVGRGVTDFESGQKVTTFVRIGPTPYGASQEYFLTMAATSWLFDAGRLSDEQAATIPLALCTAGDALYNKMDPRLPLPWETPFKRPILIWGSSSQVGTHAVQFAREAGCAPIIATASPKHHAYIKSLGADFVFDYRDPKVEDKVKGVSKEITHTFTCVGVDEMVLGILERLTQRGGNIILALPPIRDTPNHHSEMCVAGTIMGLESFEMPSFKFHGGHEPPTSSEGAKRLQGLMRWALEEAGKKYSLPRVRRLSRRGLFDVLEAIELMKAGKISGEKVVYRMDETPEI